MRIAAVGCSHAYNYSTKPWPSQLGTLLEAEVILAASPGAGVGIGVDKLCYILENNKVDHVFFQAPADLRICIGMNSKVSNESLIGQGSYGVDDLRNGNQFFTFIMTLVNGNKRAFNKLIEQRTDDLWDKFDEVYKEYFFDNFYETRINFVKHLIQVQNLCTRHKVSYTMFTWHDFPWDNQNVLLQSWINQLDKRNLIPESVINFNKRHRRMTKNEFVNPAFSSDGYHLNNQASLILAQDYILPFYHTQTTL